MKRRAFFKHTLLPVLLSSFKMNALAGSPLMQSLLGATTNGRVLVIIQLAGGNDGLNTVIPIEFYSAYKNARPNIAIEETKILRLQGHDKTGLNPAMGLMQQLFNEDKLAIIQAVSYPKPNFSHFKATDIWLTGEDSDKDLNTGWMGSYLNNYILIFLIIFLIALRHIRLPYRSVLLFPLPFKDLHFLWLWPLATRIIFIKCLTKIISIQALLYLRIR